MCVWECYERKEARNVAQSLVTKYIHLLKRWEASGIQVLPKNGHLPAVSSSHTKAHSGGQLCRQLQTPSCRAHWLWHPALRLLLLSKCYKGSLADLSKLQDTKISVLVQRSYVVFGGPVYTAAEHRAAETFFRVALSKPVLFH